jgi:hypothetical protein
MASGEGVRLSRVTKWDVNLHAPRARLSTPRVVPAHDQTAANDEGKPSSVLLKLYSVAHIRCHWAPLIRQSLAVHAATDVLADEVCQLEPLVYTTAAYANIMPGICADYGGYDMELPVAIEPGNSMWRETATTFAQSCKYGGFSRDQYPRGNEERLMRYKDDVKMAIFLCQGPRAVQTSVDFVASFCAVALCEGRAKLIVQQMVEKDGKLPLKRELFFKLQADIRTQPIHFWIPSYNCPE